MTKIAKLATISCNVKQRNATIKCTLMQLVTKIAKLQRIHAGDVITNMANSRNIVPNCMYGLAISQRYGAILSDTCVAISHESATVSWAFEQYFGASWLMQGTLHMAVRCDGRCATHRASSVCTSSVSTMSRQGSLHTSPVSTWSRQGSLLT